MSYEITVSGSEVVSLKENDNQLFLVDLRDGPKSIHFHDDLENVKHAQKFEPSPEFWKALVEMNSITSDLSDTIKHLTVPEKAVPDRTQWKLPHYPHLPKYEELLVMEIGWYLFMIREGTIKPFEDYPTLRRLFRAAYTETTGSVPDYLTETRY